MSNVNKNIISFIDDSKKIHILILVILGTIALSIRLFFLPFNLPLENNNWELISIPYLLVEPTFR